MSLKERSYSVLLVSASEHFNSGMLPLLSGAPYTLVRQAASVGAAKRAVLEKSFDFVLINAPLPDDGATGLAIDLCQEGEAVVLLLVRRELYLQLYDQAADHGVFLLPKPTSRQMILQALEWMASARERLRRMEKKTLTISQKMEEIRTVNRAKWLLIDREGMTEPEAHRFIEKRAMDRCLTRRQVAEGIISSYCAQPPEP